MAYNYFNQQGNQMMPQQFQNQMFPQPSGNVYAINNSNELTNIPVGVGLTVALCLPENMLYLKSIQNGSPVIWSYQLTTQTEQGLQPAATVEEQSKPVPQKNNSKIEQIENRLSKLEKAWEEQINEQF